MLFPCGCMVCGTMSEDLKYSLCHRCRKSLPLYLKETKNTYYIFEYNHKIAGLLKKAKYANKPRYIKNLACCMGDMLAEKGEKPDMVVYVPMYYRDLGERGYNQSKIAAKEIAGAIGSPCPDNILLKVRKTRKQAALNKSKREENIKNAFRSKEKLITGKRILLVDDIMTTGSTLNECRKELLAKGAKEVKFAVIAYTPVIRRKAVRLHSPC